jgi:two-component system KDP operon response regulator KdpE
MRILIADTNPEIKEDVRLALNRCQPDWQLSVVSTGKQCLNMIRGGNCPDAVILGMQLFDMSGLELTGLIRDDSDVPIIFLSNSKDVEVLVKAFDAGANDYMVFPFSKAIFMARVKAQIRRRTWDIWARDSSMKMTAERQECISLSWKLGKHLSA